MKTFKQLQNLLTENKNNLDPAGVPNFAFDKLSAHEKMRYKTLWKKMGLPTDFEERIEKMGGKTTKSGFDFGKRGRGNDLPDFVIWYKNGQKTSEVFHKNGKEHRDGDKPAMILWYDNGQKSSEVFYKNGKKHRDGDKPAEIWWNENGQKQGETFYKNGKQYTP